MRELRFLDNFLAHLLLCQKPLDRSTLASRAARLAAEALPSSVISFSYLRSLSFLLARMDSTRMMSSSMAQLKRLRTYESESSALHWSMITADRTIGVLLVPSLTHSTAEGRDERAPRGAESTRDATTRKNRLVAR